MNVLVFKLSTGEEIIAEVTNDDTSIESTGVYIIKNALALILSPNQGGGLGVSVFPWGNHVTGEIPLKEEDVIYTGTPRSELVDMYEKAFSKLALPTNSLITG